MLDFIFPLYVVEKSRLIFLEAEISPLHIDLCNTFAFHLALIIEVHLAIIPFGRNDEGWALLLKYLINYFNSTSHIFNHTALPRSFDCALTRFAQDDAKSLAKPPLRSSCFPLHLVKNILRSLSPEIFEKFFLHSLALLSKNFETSSGKDYLKIFFTLKIFDI